MAPSPISYADLTVKQRVESWAEGLEFDAEEQLLMLLEDKFGVDAATIVDARPVGDFIMLTIGTDLWKEPRDFAVLKSGSLAW